VAERVRRARLKSGCPQWGRAGSSPAPGIVSLRRFVIGWTGVAFVVWLPVVAAFESDEDCSAPTAGYVCFDTHAAVIAGSLVVGIPWLVGLVIAGLVVLLVRGRRSLGTG
jgi:hypothetical protein